MARFRNRMSMRPIQRIKHVVDTQGTLASGTQLLANVALAKDAPVLANTVEVVTGSTVNGIYLKVEVASNEVATAGLIPNVYMFIAKNPGGNITMPNANAVGVSDNKRFIIHQEMLMIENSGKGGNPRVLFNGVIAIPKGYRRFGPNDSLVIGIITPVIDIAFCWQAHYKEFR